MRYPKVESPDMRRSPTPAVMRARRIERFVSPDREPRSLATDIVSAAGD
jgi:hypothetical protein